MAKHSPGPWEADDTYVQTFNDGVIADTRWTPDPEVNEANAKLIAAAPDMLKALQALARSGLKTARDAVTQATE